MAVIKTLKNGQWTPVNSVTSLGTATTTTAGLMSASDKSKLDSVEDYIVEVGQTTTSDNAIWNYTKWASGLIEATVSSESKPVTSSSLMGGYYANVVNNVLPFNCDTTKAKIVLVYGSLGSGVSFGEGTIKNATQYNVTVWGNQNGTTARFDAYIRYYELTS